MSSRSDHRLVRARGALQRGQLAECERICRDLLAQRSHVVRAGALAGRARLCRWAAARATRQLLGAVQRDPHSVRTLLMLSFAFARQEDHEAALRWAQKTCELDSENVRTILWCAQCGLAARRPEEAESAFRAAIGLEPSCAAAQHGLGLSLIEQGKAREACGPLREAVLLDPQAPQYRLDLIEALMALTDGSEAVEEAGRFVDEWPNGAIGHLLLAQSLGGDGRPAEAESEALRAIELGPYDGAARATLGSIQMALGRLDQSQVSSRESLELDPRQGLAYFNLIRARKSTDLDRPMLDRMAELVQDESLAKAQRGLLAYGLGKGLEDLKAFEQAMGYYDQANQIEFARKFGAAAYDMNRNLEAHESIRERFSGELPHCEADSEKITPIFVIGMIRSGTTLLEQILSSHPEVGGAGEVPFWLRRGRAETLDVPALAEEYIEVLMRAAPGRRFVVDKMPTNYMLAGLLHAAFPSAPILHIRRDPLDTCLSIYTTHNRVPIPWSHDKANIALNYRQYVDLMEFWRLHLPPGRITEVRYEELVSNPLNAIADVLNACGLEWSDACLNPERNTRSVSTPSLCQVRQPIYTSSVARWRKFEPWLGAFAQVREEAAVEA